MAVSSAEVHLRQAIADAPLRLARQALAGVGLELTHPIDQDQFKAFVALMSDKEYSAYDVGTCNFQHNRHLGRLAGYQSFSLLAVNMPQTYLNHLEELFARKKIDNREYLNQMLYSPVHTLRLDLGEAKHESFTVFAAPDLPLTAVADADLDYAEGHTPPRDKEDISDMYETRFLAHVGRMFGEDALIKLDDPACAILAEAIVATEVTL